MSDTEQEGQALPEIDAVDLNELVRLMGQVVGSASLYGPDHKVVRQSLETCFVGLDAVLDHCDNLTFGTTESGLIVNGVEIDDSNPLVSSFVKQMQDLDLGGFSLFKGIKQDHLGQLLDLLSKSPEKFKDMGGSFGDVLARMGIHNVESKSVAYKLVADEDLVVNKGEVAEQILNSRAEPERPEAKVTVDQIVAFLKGDVLPDQDKVAAGVRDAATDPAKLADLILKTAQVQQRAANLEGGESLADFVVGCIHRTYDALLESPHVKTQQGKKDLSKAVMLLEKSILDKLRSVTAVTDKALAAITSAVEDINSELAIEAISTEYLRKRAALETTEAKVVRFLKKTEHRKAGAGEAMRAKLIEGGLSLDGWKEIVVKSGAPGSGPGRGGTGGASPDGMRGIGMLAMLLSKLDEMMGSIKRVDDGRKPTEDLTRLVREIEEEVNQSVARTEQRVDDLAQTVSKLEKLKDAKATPEVAMEISVWKDTLAEIVQELRQLITVISSALQMIRSGRLGDVSHDQADMLTLASSSNERLMHLAERIYAISGVPVSMEPDGKLIRSLFK